MILRPIHRVLCSVLAATVLMVAAPAVAQTGADYSEKAERYAEARRTFDDEAAAYWKSIAEKRRGRNAKRRSNERRIAILQSSFQIGSHVCT